MLPARSRWAIAVAVISGGVLACGCSRKAGPARYPVTGTVTYAGKPLLAGRIAFEPDTRSGNKGPAAYGDISAGRYKTYGTAGAVGGPHRVVIEGYSGTTAVQTRRMSPLFPPHITTVDLPQEQATVDFDVPAATPPGRKPEDKKRISAGR
jgi:hypothetical protein